MLITNRLFIMSNRELNCCNILIIMNHGGTVDAMLTTGVWWSISLQLYAYLLSAKGNRIALPAGPPAAAELLDDLGVALFQETSI